jgi:hypothetical protein
VSLDNFWSNLIRANKSGLAAGIHRLQKHDGGIHYTLLSKVEFLPSGAPKVTPGTLKSTPFSSLSIMIGGEVANSFTPLYEFSYFMQALLLSAAFTAVKESIGNMSTVSEIEVALIQLEEAQLLAAISAPQVAIVSNLDTDIEPFRYAKEILWGIPREKLGSRCTELIVKGVDYGVPVDFSECSAGYFGLLDLEFSKLAIEFSNNLVEAKQIQFALTLRRCLHFIGLNLENVPLYFHKVPKEELVEAGNDTIFMHSLLEMHSRPNLAIYANLVKRRQPWLIGKACPSCGESSKRIINYRLKNFGRTVRCICSNQASRFYREDGIGFSRTGCGDTFEFDVPQSPKELYEFFTRESFTINFPVRDILGVILETVYQPAIWIVTDIGIGKRENGTFYASPQPTGFGDHREMVTSTVQVHKLFLEGHLACTTSTKARLQQQLVARPVDVFGNTSPVRFTHSSLRTPDGQSLVTDTSVNQIIDSDTAMYDAIVRTCELNHFPIEQLAVMKGN